MTFDNQSFQRRTILKTISGTVIAGGVLGGVSGSAIAQRGPLYNLTFNKDGDVADWTADDPGWQRDRTEPEEWVRETGQPLNNVVRKNIDESGPTEGFFAYQGMKYMDAGGDRWTAEIPRRLQTSGSIYLDAEWEANDQERQTGIWYALGDDEGERNWWEIVEYRSSEATGNGASFRWWDPMEAEWVKLGLPEGVNPEKGGWVNLEMRAEPDGSDIETEWKIRGKQMVEESVSLSEDVDHFQELIVNSRNFGTDDNYHFDNFNAVIS